MSDKKEEKKITHELAYFQFTALNSLLQYRCKKSLNVRVSEWKKKSKNNFFSVNVNNRNERLKNVKFCASIGELPVGVLNVRFINSQSHIL